MLEVHFLDHCQGSGDQTQVHVWQGKLRVLFESGDQSLQRKGFALAWEYWMNETAIVLMNNCIILLWLNIVKTVLKPTLRAFWEGQKQESHHLRAQGKPMKKYLWLNWKKKSLYFHCCEKYLGQNPGLKFLPYHLLLCPHDRSAGRQSEQFNLKLPPILNDCVVTLFPGSYWWSYSFFI